MINSISIGKLFWGEITPERISFSYPDLPRSVHLTGSFHPAAKQHNFHVTKNVGDPRNKPQIKVTTLEKDVLPAILTALPAVLLHKLSERISFKHYTRRDRKNIRVLFYDTLAENEESTVFLERIKAIYEEHATVKGSKLQLDPAFFDSFAGLACSPEIQSWFIRQLRHVNSRSFDSPHFRMGMVLLGSRSYTFFSRVGQCYILRKRGSVEDLLGHFMPGTLASGLVEAGQRAIDDIRDLTTYEGSRPFNDPFHLFIKGWR